MAPALEVARGSPQDSICMMVATRFGSSCEAAAHFEMEAAQYWISVLKMGEIFVETTGGNSTTDGDDGMEDGLAFQAKDARKALTRITAIGTIIKSDKQPLPCSCGAAAVCL